MVDPDRTGGAPDRTLHVGVGELLSSLPWIIVGLAGPAADGVGCTWFRSKLTIASRSSMVRRCSTASTSVTPDWTEHPG